MNLEVYNTATLYDQIWMTLAFSLAEQAQSCGEVPIGAVVVRDNCLLGVGHNACITHNDPTAHAEIQAMRQAASQCGNYRLVNTVMYTTLEPCAMCAGAMVHARISRLCIAASDPKAGACGSVLDITQHPSLNHRVKVTIGLQASRSQQLLQQFFRARR